MGVLRGHLRGCHPSGGFGRRENLSEDGSAKLDLSGPRGDGAPGPAERETDELGATDVGGASPALVDLVLELDEEAALRLRSGRRPRGAFGTGAQISMSGDDGVGPGTAGGACDPVGHAVSYDEGGPAVGPRAEVTPGGALGRGATGSKDAKPELELSGPSRGLGDGVTCPAERDVAGASGHALAELVIELEEHAALRLRSGRRGTGAQIQVTGDEVVGPGTGRHPVGCVTSSDEGGPAAGPRAEVTPGSRRAPKHSQGPPGGAETEAGAEPAAALPDEGQRRARD